MLSRALRSGASASAKCNNSKMAMTYSRRTALSYGSSPLGSDSAAIDVSNARCAASSSADTVLDRVGPFAGLSARRSSDVCVLPARSTDNGAASETVLGVRRWP